MFYVYVLKSLRNSRRYVGFTAKLPEERLAEHNGGANVFTKHNAPFVLVYFEKYQDENFARKRERFLKSGHGREFLKQKMSP